jgi:hypothetical protein
MQRRIDMLIGTTLQTLCKPVVFVMTDILSCFQQQIPAFFQPAAMVAAFVHRRMVFKILSVIDGSLPDLADRSIDLLDRIYFVHRLVPVTRTMFQHPAGCPKV